MDNRTILVSVGAAFYVGATLVKPSHRWGTWADFAWSAIGDDFATWEEYDNDSLRVDFADSVRAHDAAERLRAVGFVVRVGEGCVAFTLTGAEIDAAVSAGVLAPVLYLIDAFASVANRGAGPEARARACEATALAADSVGLVSAVYRSPVLSAFFLRFAAAARGGASYAQSEIEAAEDAAARAQFAEWSARNGGHAGEA